MGSTIYNPAAGDVYYDTAGSATASDTQPKLTGGAAAGLGVNQTLLDDSPISRSQADNYGLPVSGVDDCTRANPAATEWCEGDFVIMKYTTDLAGVSNTTLRSGAAAGMGRRGIKSRLYVRGPLTATSIRLGYWNEFSGIFATGVHGIGIGIVESAPTSSTSGLAGADAGAGTDDAANPSAATPGELTYHYGSGAQPSNDEYAARTLW